jgi:sulfur-oxidizing protein SoxZ
MARTLINVPKTTKAGELVEIKVLIAHPMETGFRPGPNGRLLPRDIVTRFTCLYDGEEVFAADLSPAMAANPFIAFATVATRSGKLTFIWEGDNGFAQTETADLVVEA